MRTAWTLARHECDLASRAMSHAIDAVIRARRTHKNYAGSPLTTASVRELLDLAVLAPNHRMSQPWRYAVLDQAAIAALAAWLPTQPDIVAFPDPAKGAAKLAKLLERLPSLGAMVQMTCIRDADPGHHLEDLLACGAAVQNLLLAAEARGLASFWSTNAALGHPQTLRRYGADPAREIFVASLWLGGRVETPVAPPRQPLDAVLRIAGAR